jgi:hypothetical protein
MKLTIPMCAPFRTRFLATTGSKSHVSEVEWWRVTLTSVALKPAALPRTCTAMGQNEDEETQTELKKRTALCDSTFTEQCGQFN